MSVLFTHAYIVALLLVLAVLSALPMQPSGKGIAQEGWLLWFYRRMKEVVASAKAGERSE